MVQTPIQQMTLIEFLAIPETKPADEFIDGVIYPKLMPQGEHSTIQRELTFALESFSKTLRERPLRDRKIARAFPELRCTFGERSIVPDISIVCSDRIPRNLDGTIENVFSIAPELDN